MSYASNQSLVRGIFFSLEKGHSIEFSQFVLDELKLTDF